MDLCSDLRHLDHEVLPEVAAGHTEVLICSDVTKGRPGRRLVETMCEDSSDAHVTMVRNLCASSAKVRAAVNDSGASRVVVVCRNGSEVRGEIKARLRKVGLHPAGIVVLEMEPGTQLDPDRVNAMSVARIRAAIARVSASDFSRPVPERKIRSAVRLSRRNLFHPGDIERGPLADWLEDRCERGGACQACVYACPRGALSRAGDQIVVDEDLCTGCGGCVSVCRAGAMSLGGVPIEAREAEANVLIYESYALMSRPGIALVCANSSVSMPLGGDWLTLEVPSIEMVSVGWALQILAAGVSVRLIGCDDDGCNVRAREIAQLCASLIDAAALELGQPPSISANADPPNSIRSSSRAVTLSRESVGAVAFREPEASVSALSLVGTAKSDGVKRDSRASWLDEAVDTKPGRPWRIESTLLPFGEVTVDESLCSACGRCAFVCASGALAMEDVSDAVIALTLDSHACSACEVCVLSCPEGAITLRRVASAERLIPHRIRVKIVNQLKCVACGSKLAGGLATSVISERLASSHPQLANRLLTEVKCADCMLAR